jgi:glyoxylase-like metal-dependent hydrolase (beta-lactamase superfamily II)/rhodanese-related sulfurtransferase
VEIRELNDANCKTYILVSGNHAALIDPVRERALRYRREVEEHGWQLELIIETHTHADHMMISRELKEALGAPYLMHRESPIPIVDRHLSDGETLELGEETIEVLHTPGHTPDSICLRVPGAVLTGDTLLIGGSGRTDFPGGDAGAQYDAVTSRLFRLPDDTVVWPGHDYKGRTASTIGDERRANPRFLDRSREQYVEAMANLGLPLPDRIQGVLQVNQSSFEHDEVAFPPVTEVATVEEVGAPDVERRLRSDSPPLLVDVREPEEFVGELGHIEGALLVPLDALGQRLPKLAGYVDRDIVVVCRAGARSATAAAMLRRAGFSRIANLEGGMLAWVRASLPVQH